ncbi:MAG: hypothetical protein ISS36_03340 [Candidatus Aenigmarchaeota archaeon]|nr:hypothetical protein [Candidatus Aenigmarchaeota archaeon]
MIYMIYNALAEKRIREALDAAKKSLGEDGFDVSVICGELNQAYDIALDLFPAYDAEEAAERAGVQLRTYKEIIDTFIEIVDEASERKSKSGEPNMFGEETDEDREEYMRDLKDVDRNVIATLDV